MFRTDNTDESNGSTPRTVLSTDCAVLLETLGNASSRAILTEAAGTAHTVDELIETCDVSRTTIYRRVNELIDLGLLEESMRFTEGNQRQRQFRTTGDEITIRIGPDGFEARIESTGADASAEGLLLDESSQQFRIALSGTDLRCRIETDGDNDPDATESAD